MRPSIVSLLPGLTALFTGCITVQVPDRDDGVTAGPDSGSTPMIEARPESQTDVDAAPNGGQPVPFCAGRPTTWIRISANLDATAAVAPAFDLTQPAQTATKATSLEVWSTPGVGGELDVYFSMTSRTTYDYHVLIGTTPGYAVELGRGTLSFSANGALEDVTETLPLMLGTPGTPSHHVELVFGTPIAAGGTGLDGISSFASPFAVREQVQDGCAAAIGTVCPVRPAMTPGNP